MVSLIRRYIILLLTALFSVTVISGDARGQEPQGNTKSGSAVDALKDSVLSYFNPVNGSITEAGRDTVKVNFRDRERLKKGMRLSIFREGKPFYHPVTKEPIGKSESFIGRIEITDEIQNLQPGAPLNCRVINGSPQAGDLARITSSGITLAFYQGKDTPWSLSETFYNALKGSGRFNLKEGSYIKSYDTETISKQAAELGAEAIIFFSTLLKDSSLLLNVKLIWPEDGKVFAEFQETAEQDFVREIESSDELMSLGTVEEEPRDSYRIPAGELIAAGDVDGNGEKELIVSDGNTIKIYKFKQEPHEIWSIKGSPYERHLSINTLDLNGNGRDEIFITSLTNINSDAGLADSEMKRKGSVYNMISFALEYSPSGGYKRIWDINSYALRVVGKTLLMQRFTLDRAFTGPVYKGIWKDGDYITENPLELPEGIEIYGFAYVDRRSSGHANVLVFNDRGYLNLYDGGELIWSSKDSYGKFESFAKQSYSVANQDAEWFMKGRLISLSNKQGDEAIVVKKIPFLNKLESLGYKKSEVYSLRWDGEAMAETLIAGDINGTVTDYWAEGDDLLLIVRQNMYMFLKKSLSGDLMKGSILYYYNFSGK